MQPANFTSSITQSTKRPSRATTIPRPTIRIIKSFHMANRVKELGGKLPAQPPPPSPPPSSSSPPPRRRNRTEYDPQELWPHWHQTITYPPRPTAPIIINTHVDGKLFTRENLRDLKMLNMGEEVVGNEVDMKHLTHDRPSITACLVTLTDTIHIEAIYHGKTIQIRLDNHLRKAFMPLKVRRPIYVAFDIAYRTGPNMTESDSIEVLGLDQPPASQRVPRVFPVDEKPRANFETISICPVSLDQLITLRSRFETALVFAFVDGKKEGAFAPEVNP
ncbi:hypothetical protein F4778DRAFT_732488 [Xylariomycetidae sp. FL2044]|nr:hypothetical protein F4778DRAFT_732488 [Xylariomycetidae sp. FL2044]